MTQLGASRIKATRTWWRLSYGEHTCRAEVPITYLSTWINCALNSCPKWEQWLLSLCHTNVPSSSMWREARAMNTAGYSIHFPQSQHKLVPSKWLKERDKLFCFPCHCPPSLVATRLNPGRNLSASFTSHLQQSRYAPESPSEAGVKSQHPTCSFPHHCWLVRHLHRRAIFGVPTASPIQFIPGSVHNHYFIPSLTSLML